MGDSEGAYCRSAERVEANDLRQSRITAGRFMTYQKHAEIFSSIYGSPKSNTWTFPVSLDSGQILGRATVLSLRSSVVAEK